MPVPRYKLALLTKVCACRKYPCRYHYITLTPPNDAAIAIGMVVYNTNAIIAGTTTYPAYGAGLYIWDGPGWKGTPVVSATPTLPQTVLVASGVKSANTGVPNRSMTLDLSKVSFVSTSTITMSNDTTFTTAVAGTYKIDAIMQINYATNPQNLTNFIVDIRLINLTNPSTPLMINVINQPSSTLPQSMALSYVGDFPANTSLILKGNMDSNSGLLRIIFKLFRCSFRE